MRAPAIDRRDQTREKLLGAAVDVFGRYGFDGATTRMLSEAAGVNQQAIPYHFGGKEGLYIAAAEHIAGAMGAHLSPLRDRVGAAPVADPAEARRLLCEILQAMAALFVSRASEPWARFLIREQMAPTDAFRRVYESVMSPMLDVISRLVGILLEEPASSQHVRLRTLSLVGSVMVFRVAHAAVLAKLQWKALGPGELAAIQALCVELVDSVSAMRPADGKVPRKKKGRPAV